MDATQALLFGVVTVLTLLLVAVGIQVFFILREVRQALDKINKILDDASFVSGAVAKPVAGLASFVEGIKGIRELVDLVSEKAKEKSLASGHSESPKEEAQLPQESYSQQPPRFFHRGGKPLTS